jgi:hypothetical protein
MSLSPQAVSEFVRSRLPSHGLFAGLEWRIAYEPFRIDKTLEIELQKLGRVLLQFNRAVNQLYRKSVAGKMPAWIAEYLDRGKPQEILDWQRSSALKSDLPRVIRPDILITENGLKISELDSVPGGIGLTAWLNKTYSELREQGGDFGDVIGRPRGMHDGFASIFPKDGPVHIVVSKESETYAPEMEWLAGELTPDRFHVRDSHFRDFQPGDSVYRFFELFDVPNVKNGRGILERAVQGDLYVTSPPKAFFEEKMVLALLWNRNLREFWRQELGDAFLKKMLELVPYSWIVDPAPLPPHGAIPELNLTDWHQLKSLSQRERNLILKVSGFSESAWGARGVHFGSDMPASDWSAAVDGALHSFDRNPYILQKYEKPVSVGMKWVDPERGTLEKMDGRVRLCPYYFVEGEGDAARANLGGVLATICPADKKIIHGMREAVLAPVVAG